MAVQRSPKPLMRVRFLSPLPIEIVLIQPGCPGFIQSDCPPECTSLYRIIDEELQVKPGAFFFILQA